MSSANQDANPAAIAGPILIVDDDAEVRQVIQWALEDEGHAVEVAADGRQAIERASHRRPGLVVLDLSLPVLDGFQVASALRATHGRTLPILMITADGSAAAKARRVGAYSYLRKPFEIERLVAAVRQGLEG